MKLLFVIYSGPSPEHVTQLLERHHSPGFTILEGGTGMGETGRLEGNRIWPGTATTSMPLTVKAASCTGRSIWAAICARNSGCARPTA